MIVRYKVDFQHVLALQELQQMIDMLYVRQMAEKFLSTLLLMFILHVTLFIMHVEIQKEFGLVMQMTLEDVLVQRFKKQMAG